MFKCWWQCFKKF